MSISPDIKLGTTVTVADAISTSIAQIAEPWDRLGLERPIITVKEVARVTRLGEQGVIDRITRGHSPFSLFDTHGSHVNGNLRQAAIDSAPMKRVMHHVNGSAAGYRELAYIHGRGRLRIFSAA